MSKDHPSELRTLERDECFERLRGSVTGRVAYVVDGMAVIVPVNFALVDADIVFCTSKGSKLAWLGLRHRLAFQVDDTRPASREGWSVLIHGSAHEITDPNELDALRRGPLQPWVQPPDEHWVRIVVEAISGRALERGQP